MTLQAKAPQPRNSNSAPNSDPTVSAWTEWDPLEEVIVGIVEGSAVPQWDVALEATIGPEQKAFFDRYAGQPFPQEMVDAAKRELDGFVALLEREGITVRRPERVDFSRPFATPAWSSPGGLYAAMPRDLLLVIGDELIEVPMAWRSRYFEIEAYRPLLTEYFRAGARWTAAPSPLLTDAAFHAQVPEPTDGRPFASVVTEHEPVFDAADFIRCGRDIFGQLSHVTNRLGFEWLRRHLETQGLRVHEVDLYDEHPMHIDASLTPLAPGKLLINPERVPEVPEMFKDWDVRPAPPPALCDRGSFKFCSRWVSINLVSLDAERVVVEENETPLIEMLEDWGFEVLTLPFLNFNDFGGSFHCATLDVRRSGELESYF